MNHNIISLTLIAIGAATAITAGFGLMAKLMGREPEPSPTVRSFISTLLGIWIISLVKYWYWKEDRAITGIFVLGIGIVIAGVILR